MKGVSLVYVAFVVLIALAFWVLKSERGLEEKIALTCPACPSVTPAPHVETAAPVVIAAAASDPKTVAGATSASADQVQNYYHGLRKHLMLGCADVCDTSDRGTKGLFAPAVKKEINCLGLFANPLHDASAWLWPPLRHIPDAFKDDYTMNGIYNSVGNQWYAQKYSGATAMQSEWDKEMVDEWVKQAAAGQLKGNYGVKETGCLQKAFAEAEKQGMGVRGKHIAVLGSENPWVEAALLAAGAKHVTTVEYGKIISKHPQISSITPQELAAAVMQDGLEAHAFDGWASFSSVEHSGMGRYGDELNPWGDLVASARMWCLTRDNGPMFMATYGPHANEGFEFNAHRHYGPIRYGQLFANWDQVYQSCGSQATFVLRKGTMKGAKDKPAATTTGASPVAAKEQTADAIATSAAKEGGCQRFQGKQVSVAWVGRGRSGGGLGDRLVGCALDSYLWAQALGREFLIAYEDPLVPLTNYYAVPDEFLYSKHSHCLDESKIQEFRWMDLVGIAGVCKLEQQLKDVGVAKFSYNVGMFSYGLECPENDLTKKMTSLVGADGWWKDAALKLFPSSDNLKTLVNAYVPKFEKYTVVGLQIRTLEGENWSDSSRQLMKVMDKIVDAFVYCGKLASISATKELKWLVVSDNSKISEMVGTRVGKDNVITVAGGLAHVARSSEQDIQNANDRLFVELELLSLADYAVISRNSNFGRLARLRSATLPMAIDYFADVGDRPVDAQTCVQLKGINLLSKGYIDKENNARPKTYIRGVNQRKAN